MADLKWDFKSGIEVLNSCLDLLGRDWLVKPVNAILAGKAIYNSYPDREEGLAIWRERLTKAVTTVQILPDGKVAIPLNLEPTLPIPNLETEFDSFDKNNNYTYRTIAYIAYNLETKAFVRWHADFIREFMEAATSSKHSDVAKALYWSYFFNYCCTDLTNSGKATWLKYRRHFWVKMDAGVDILNLMSGGFSELFQMLYRVKSKALDNPNQTEDKDKIKIIMDRIRNLLDQLKNHQFKKSVLAELANLFYVEDFESKRDRAANVMATLNCVLEAGPKHCLVRSGHPEDYLTKHLDLEYPLGITETDPNVCVIYTWLAHCYCQVETKADGSTVCNKDITREVVEYILKIWSSALQGKNTEKLFVVLTGEGNNSKSMIKKLHKKVFGPWSQDLDFGSVKGTTKAGGGPNPALAKLDGAKEAWLSEPDSGETVSDGVIKLLTGGDSFFARLLNQNGKDIQATCLLLLMCNQIPSIPAGRAMKNRIRVIEHTGVWKVDAPTDPDEQLNTRTFPLDPTWEEKLDKLAPYFLWLLVRYYSIYKVKGLKIPDSVQARTDEYWENTDTYNLFIKRFIQLAIIPGSNPEKLDSSYNVTVGDAYQTFQNWHRTDYPGTPVPNRITFVANLESKLGKLNGQSRWYGIKLDQYFPGFTSR